MIKEILFGILLFVCCVSMVSAVSIPQLTFHEVSDNWQSSPYSINTSNFEGVLKFLHDNGYVSITFKDYYLARSNPSLLPDKPIILVFDDGTDTQFFTAKPLMMKYGFRGVLAVISDKVGVKGFVNVKQLKDFRDSGWEIASHSRDHVSLVGMNSSSMIQEYLSRDVLKGYVDSDIVSFIYPYNEQSSTMRLLCLKYFKGCTGDSSYIGSSRQYYMTLSDDLTKTGMRRISTNNVNKLGIQTLIQVIQ